MHPGSVLPMPDSLLSPVVPAPTIVAANEEVKKVISTDANKENTACVLRTSTILRKGLHLEKGSRAWCNSDRTIPFQSVPWPSSQGQQCANLEEEVRGRIGEE